LKVSAKGEYTLRAMLELAQSYKKGPLTIKEIGERQAISVYYLEQLLSKVRHAKLVKSIRGPHGGYRLARNPSAITVGDVLKVAEGSFCPVTCLDESTPVGKRCRFIRRCVARLMWQDLHTSMMEVLGKTTLQDLLNRGRAEGLTIGLA
jgi:Rrf2 family protein